MKDRIDALLLLKQLREHLQSNHGIEKENLHQALIMLDEGIHELEGRRANNAVSCDWILDLITRVVMVLPGFIYLINKYWK